MIVQQVQGSVVASLTTCLTSTCDSNPGTACVSANFSLFCEPCAPQQITDGMRCTTCAAGKQPAADHRQCSPCPAGQSGIGGTCSRCVPGTVPDAHNVTCTQCTQIRKKSVKCFSHDFISTDAQPCESCSFIPCAVCNATQAAVQPRPGWAQPPVSQRSRMTVAALLRCPQPSSCVQRALNNGSVTACLAGYTGILCAACARNYYVQGVACIRCGSRGLRWLHVGFMCGALATLAAVVATIHVAKGKTARHNDAQEMQDARLHGHLLRHQNDDTLGNDSSTRPAATAASGFNLNAQVLSKFGPNAWKSIKIALSFGQVVSQLESVLHYTYTNAATGGSFHAMQALALNVASVVRLECWGVKHSYYPMWVSQTILLPSIMLTVLLLKYVIATIGSTMHSSGRCTR